MQSFQEGTINGYRRALRKLSRIKNGGDLLEEEEDSHFYNLEEFYQDRPEDSETA